MTSKRTNPLLSRREGLLLGGTAVGAALGGLLHRSEAARGPLPLRPPGALPEPAFLATCIRCGQCVEACPVDALHVAGIRDGIAHGTPYVTPRQAPCTICEGYAEPQCIPACPTAAIGPVAKLADIRMGVARVDPDRCLAWIGTPCRACWHACPLPNEAVVMDGLGRPTIDDEACIGCGLCDHACLTDPSSIPIIPTAQLDPVAHVRGDQTAREQAG